jgi:hypothetical protein
MPDKSPYTQQAQFSPYRYITHSYVPISFLPLHLRLNFSGRPFHLKFTTKYLYSYNHTNTRYTPLPSQSFHFFRWKTICSSTDDEATNSAVLSTVLLPRPSHSFHFFRWKTICSSTDDEANNSAVLSTVLLPRPSNSFPICPLNNTL